MHIKASLVIQIQAFDENPLIYHGAIKARIASLLIDQIDAVVPRLGEINLPVLIIHGSGDTLVPIEASNIADKGIASSDKTYEVRIISAVLLGNSVAGPH